MAKRPIVPFVLSASGLSLAVVNVTLIILSGDVLEFEIAGSVTVWGSQQALGWMPLLLAVSIAGLLASALIFLKPALHRILGALIVSTSLTALPAGGGFLVGSILALSGGVHLVFPRVGKVINGVALLAATAALDLLINPPRKSFGDIVARTRSIRLDKKVPTDEAIGYWQQLRGETCFG